MKKEKLLEVKNLSKFFISSHGVKKAVDDISFNINKGEVLGLIGQSGSGKTTTGHAIMRLLKEYNGVIAFKDRVVSGKLNKNERKDFAKNVQMVFQNPHTALNPKRNIFSTLQEPLVVNGVLKEKSKDFLSNWKEISKYWKYTFAQIFYDLENKKIEDLTKIFKKAKQKIDIDTSEKDFKARIVDHFVIVKDFQNELNKKLDNSNIFLKKVYEKHKNKFDKNELSPDEKNMVVMQKNIKELKNFKNIAYNLENKIIKIKKAELKELKYSTLKTHKLIKSLTKDRKKRKIYLKRTKFLSSSENELELIIKDIKKAKREYSIFKKISSKKLCVYFDEVNKFDEMIYDNKDFYYVFLKKLVEEMLLANKKEFAKISNKYNSKINKAIEEWKQVLEKYRFDLKDLNFSNIKKHSIKNEIFKTNQAYKFKSVFVNIFWSKEEVKLECNNIKSNINIKINKDFKNFISNLKEVVDNNQKSNKLLFFNNVFEEQKKLQDIEKEKHLLWKKSEIKKITDNLLETKKILKSNKENFNLAKKEYQSSSLLSLNKIKNDIEANVKEKELKKEFKLLIFNEEKRINLLKVEQKILDNLFGVQKIILRIKKSFNVQRYLMVRKTISKEKVYSILKEVGLKSEHAYRYPHEFSGGQLQRIVIARSIIINPKLIIADEPVASLDVSIQAQVMNVLNELVRKRNISMLFIAHDISVVDYISDTIIIMHNGKIVEKGISKKVINNPVHPYSKTLFKSVPSLKNVKEPFKKIEVDYSYIIDYKIENPKMQMYTKDHYVLANDKQFATWRKKT